MSAQTIFYVILGIVLSSYLFERLIDLLEATRLSPVLPEELKGLYDEGQYREQQAYAKTNLRFKFVSSALDLAFTLLMLLFGGFAWLDMIVRDYTDHPILQALLFFGIFGLAIDLLSTPLTLYKTFVIEARYGFNKTTWGIFFLDKLKAYFLAAVLGGGLVALLVWLWQLTGGYFWLLSWGVVALVLIAITMFYTSLLPLFNRLKPVEDETLNEAIRRYADSVHFQVQNILEMDGSRRSTKANAFFSGVGPRRKIVLFDTLIKKCSYEEIVAVLAHEVGHYKKKHTLTSLIAGVLNVGVILFVLSLTLGQPVFAQALGVQEPSFHIGVLVFALLFAPVSLLTGILMNAKSRKNEYEADAYAAETFDGETLVSGLKRTSVDALSNLRPHPLNVFVHYSHPPVLQRIEAIRRVNERIGKHIPNREAYVS